MTKSKIRRILAITLCAAAAVLMIVSGVNMPKKGGPAGQSILEDLRLRAVLSATGSSVVESYVDIAKKEAQQRVKNAGGGMSEIREAVEKAEEEVRARYSNSEVDITGIDTAELTAATEAYAKALKAYDELDSAARAIYIEAHYAEAEAALEAKHQQMLDAGMEIPENDTVEVDMSGFVPTAEMVQAQAEADQAYLAVGAAIQKIYPVLDEESIGTLKTTVKDVVYQVGDTFDTQYDRCVEQSGAKESFAGYLIRHAADILYTAIALVVLAVLLLFNEWLVDKLGIPRVIIGLFFILLCFMTLWCGLSLPSLMSNTIVRTGMNAVMVLAMVPGIQCGISLNLGLPIGLVAGLIGGLLTIELGVPGWGGFALALAVGSVLAAVCGYLYALLLNKLKGEEMSVTTYVGFSVVSLMCIAWLVLPFRSLKLRWPLGTGLRNTIGLDSTNFRHILDDFLSIDIGGFTVPTGLLLFVAVLPDSMAVFPQQDRRGNDSRGQQRPLRRGSRPQREQDAHNRHRAFHGTWRGRYTGVLAELRFYAAVHRSPPDGLHCRFGNTHRRRLHQPLQDQPRHNRHLPLPGRADSGHACGERACARLNHFGDTAHTDF